MFSMLIAGLVGAGPLVLLPPPITAAQVDARITEAIAQQQAATAPVVTSVNGATGAVSVPVYTDAQAQAALAPALAGKATIAQIPDVSGFVTGAAVDTRIAQQLGPYAKLTQVPSISGLISSDQLNTALQPYARISQLPSTAGLVSGDQMTAALAAYAKLTQVPSTAGLVTTSALSAVQASIPAAGGTVPMIESLSGSAGSATMKFAPIDHVHPRITRAMVVTTDASGNWTASWATNPLTALPVILPVPINTGSEPIACNVSTRSSTGATGRCWLARTLPAALTLLSNLISYDVFQVPAIGSQVMVFAIPTTG